MMMRMMLSTLLHSFLSVDMVLGVPCRAGCLWEGGVEVAKFQQFISWPELLLERSVVCSAKMQ